MDFQEPLNIEHRLNSRQKKRRKKRREKAYPTLEARMEVSIFLSFFFFYFVSSYLSIEGLVSFYNFVISKIEFEMNVDRIARHGFECRCIVRRNTDLFDILALAKRIMIKLFTVCMDHPTAHVSLDYKHYPKSSILLLQKRVIKIRLLS